MRGRPRVKMARAVESAFKSILCHPVVPLERVAFFGEKAGVDLALALSVRGDLGLTLSGTAKPLNGGIYC